MNRVANTVMLTDYEYEELKAEAADAASLRKKYAALCMAQEEASPVKRYTQHGSGMIATTLEGKPAGDWVQASDYDALRTRLPEGLANKGPTPRTDGVLPSQSFIDETRLFDRHYYLPLIDLARQLERELAEAKFRPIGDNHHNAVLCPYCNPLVNGSAAVSPPLHKEKP